MTAIDPADAPAQTSAPASAPAHGPVGLSDLVPPDAVPGRLARMMERGPNPLLLALPLLLMGLVTAALAWSVLGQVDIVAPARGAVTPADRVMVVQAPEQRVVLRLPVVEGQEVRRGDLLVQFDTADLVADRDRLRRERMAAELRLLRLRATIDGADGFDPPDGADPVLVRNEQRLMEAETARHAADLASLRLEGEQASAQRDGIAAGIAKLEAVLPLVRQRAEARRALRDKQWVAQTDFLTLEQELVTAEKDLDVQRAALRESDARARLIAGRLDQAERDRAKLLSAELVEAETRLGILTEDLVKAERRLAAHELRAPHDGVVQELALHVLGGVAAAAQPLMKLVPRDAEMVVEAKVPAKDIGFLEVDQPVNVKLDAFNFTKYGAVPGRVAWIAADATVDPQQGPQFALRIALDRQTMEVDGRDVRLSAGMTATADIKTGRRRVIEYILAPMLRHKAEAMRER